MIPDLPHDLAAALAPLWNAWPPDRAMSRLVVRAGVGGEALAAATLAVEAPAIRARPDLQAAIWLYADELDRSHALSQGIHDATGSYWHAIMHRREGDFDNARYWIRRARNHPAMAQLPGYDPLALIDAAERITAKSEPADPVIATQRTEWAALFTWCARRAR